MRSKRVRTTLVLAALLIAAAPSWAQSPHYRKAYPRDDAFHLRLGLFTPDGDSEYWEDKELQFTGEAQDLENLVFGADYLMGLGDRMSLLFSGSFFEGDTTQSYLDFVDNRGDRIRHDTTLDIGSLTAGLVFHLTGPGAAIRPYIGIGGGLYFWQLEEDGDFIDENTPRLDIFNAQLRSDGVTPGYFGVVGVEVPIGRTISLFGEGRWTQAEDELSGDFEDFGKIDLSGREVSAGISWNM